MLVCCVRSVVTSEIVGLCSKVVWMDVANLDGGGYRILLNTRDLLLNCLPCMHAGTRHS